MENLYWDRVRGFISEFKIDARWVLRSEDDDKTYGSLRIVSFPNLPPGYLQSIAIFVTEVTPKTKGQLMKSLDDYKMSETELEVYSVKDNVETEETIVNAPYPELENLYSVNIFE